MSAASRAFANVREDLVRSAFDGLGNGTSDFALRHLHDLLMTVSDVAQLERAILRIAASGRLVQQRLEEGTSDDLLDELRSWKSATVHARGLRDSSDALPAVSAAELPVLLPASWAWARLGEISDLQIGRTPTRSESLYWDEPYMPFVAISDLVDGSMVETTKECVSKRAFREVYRDRCVPAGTLLYSFKLTLGKMSVTTMDAVHNEAIASVVTRDRYLRDYLFKVLRAVDPTGRTNNAVKGKTLNSKTIALLEVPVAPAAEQARIVEALEGLLTLTGSLRDQLAFA